VNSDRKTSRFSVVLSLSFVSSYRAEDFSLARQSLMAAESVSGLLESVRLASEPSHAIVQAVRHCVQERCRSLTEEVKYGGLVFASDGLPFGGVFVYRQHVSVELSCGAFIADPHGLLEGSGKGRRHLKLRSLEDIKSKHLETYLTLAVQAAQAQASPVDPLE